MAIGFLLIAPSAVGVGYRPPELVRTAVGVPDEQEQQDLVELAGEIQQIPGVLGFFDHSSPTDAGVLIEDDDSTAETVAALVVLAVANRLCLVGYDIAGGTVGDVLVNATGGPTDCRMRTSQDAVTLHVSRQSITDALGADIAANEGPDGRPFIVIEPVDPALSPVPGVVFVQAARTPGGRWIIEHRSGDRIMALEYPVVSVEYLIDVLSLFINGDGEEFLDLEWEETDVTVDALDGTAPTTAPTQPQPVTFLFFRAEDFDDAPGEFRTARDFAAAAGEFADIASGAPRDAEAPATPATPQVLDDLAAWMNRRALQAAEDPENPPSHLYMDLDPYPVRPRGAILKVTVPLAAEIHDDTFADLILHAATTGVCMLEENGRVWVNASGLAPGAPPTLCRFSVRGGGLVASATPESLRATLESAVIAGTEGFVLSVEPTGRGVPAPVDGVREVQVGIGDHRWIVHRLAEGERLSLVDPGSTVEDIVDLLTGFMAGDATVLLDREWEDISEGTVPDETTRWQLSDSVGNVFNVGEVEVHVAVPMNYAPDLDWFQVADQVVLGDYITADRHLGTRWSVMWGHGYGEEQYYRRIVDSREDAESLIHAWIDESEQDFLARGWDLVDND
ncbi:hypothetical protein [Corynebacterium variabile]|uniref:Uncharacterized protein n=1 Tax=Corynebacterium variabile TaxID=1727 RepID=A0A4Y4BWZ2_9CORY|nr:hypothetical protein [Corynebacterium variabile]MDN6660731.1 hypothetical protein [Corynebacterium variabile]GEC85371.1 hypothetical protein CVA01_06850 [Corynebacterium variabile]